MQNDCGQACVQAVPFFSQEAGDLLRAEVRMLHPSHAPEVDKLVEILGRLSGTVFPSPAGDLWIVARGGGFCSQQLAWCPLLCTLCGSREAGDAGFVVS
jgi:hypothetical protein